jgi:flagellar P-ring protein precursor FlgI
VKGQEVNTLHGFGLVVGLNGTGDGDKPATRMLAQSMSRMGANVGRDAEGALDLTELKNAKNVALVFVTAEVPATGGRQGGRINCEVSAVSAKSLSGGTLLMTPLLGSHPSDRTIYASASGAITIEDAGRPTVGRAHRGGQLTEDFEYAFHEGGVLTLVLDPTHSSFQMAQIVADAINPLETRDIGGSRVVIREKSQVIVVGRDVMIRPVAVAHKNLTIEAGGRDFQDFVQVAPTRNSADPSFALSSLVNALNALKVEPADKIEIIKAIHAQGALIGKLVIE